MFVTSTFLALLAFAAPSFVRADMNPTEPAPASIYNAGSSCSISWTGDSTSTTAWKNMAIELMSGSNYQMVHITTVTTNQDGTLSGSYSWNCPQVTPYSEIYFYQFTAPNATDAKWTGRFTIASPSGQSVPPQNSVQPGTGDAIPWGTGQLVDPSKAIAAPSYETSSIAASSITSNATSSVPAANLTSSGAATNSATQSFTTVVTSSSSSSTASPSSTAQSTSGASDAMIVGFDTRVFGMAAAAALALIFVS